MSKIEKLKDIVTKAQQLQDDTTRMYRLFQDDFHNEKAKINSNEEYSEKGKAKLIESLKARKSVEFLKGARQQKTAFNKYLNDAKKEAESIIYGKSPKVDADKLDRFTSRFKEVKTEILLASSPRRGKEILEQFLGTIDEQGLAMVVKGEFGEVIQPILAEAGSDVMKYRNDLNKAFEDLKTRSMDPDAIEAMRLADYADTALNTKYFSPIVEQNVLQNFGRLAQSYMERPDEYFQEFPEDNKPASPFS
jgi:hypothetical protein